MDQIAKDLQRNIGASDLGALMGVDPYRDAGDVWDRLNGLSNVPYTAPMRRGHRMEDIIAREYGEATGRTVLVQEQKLQDPNLPCFVGHIDRRLLNGTGKDGVLEIKSRNGHMVRKIKREGLDLSTLLQIQGYLRLTGWHYGAFATIDYDSWQLLHFDIEPDPEIQGQIITTIGDFWQRNVLGNVRPTGDTKTVEVDLPATAQGEVFQIDQDPAWFKAVADLREAKQLAEDATLIKAAAQAELQGLMAEYGADVCEGAGARVYWKEQNGRRSLDVKALQKAHPEIDLGPYYKQGKPFKSFRPYWLE